MQAEAVYQQGHRWFNQEQINYGPPETDDPADYSRWATANMVLLHLRALDGLDPDTVSREDRQLAKQVDTIQYGIMMEIVGGWPALFSCAEYILKSENLNLCEEGKKEFRQAFETLVKLNPHYAECKEGFIEILGVLDKNCPEYARAPI